MRADMSTVRSCPPTRRCCLITSRASARKRTTGIRRSWPSAGSTRMQHPATPFAILAYEGIEPIDIGATYGVLSMARRLLPGLRFFVVAKSGGELRMANGLRLLADYGFADCPPAEVLMVLGGARGGAGVCDSVYSLFLYM